MLKFSIIFIFLAFSIHQSSSTLKITCTYQVMKDILDENSASAVYAGRSQPQVVVQGTAKKLQNVYQCLVTSAVTILTNGVNVTNATGIHITGYTDNDVTSISFKDKTIYYFPSGINEVYANILALAVTESKLREICQVDLKNFVHLRYLNLRSNDLVMLNGDLFKYNTELETIILSFNKIKQVDVGTFDAMPNLGNLWIEHNSCVSSKASNSTEVGALVVEMKGKCISCEKLEIESRKYFNETIELKAELEKKEAKIAELENKLEAASSKNSA